ncbi:MAG TPA: type I restriction endonuclease, partial [Hyphomonas sp.]|nr:type I restriction endonuclease [Hyphomonas sp.]
MAFNESNTVEAYVRDLLAGPVKAVPANTAQEPQASYGPSPKGIGWRYAAPSEVPRQIQEVLVEHWLRDALIRLNPEIAAQPDRADEVLYKLRAIVLSVRSDGLIRANEEMTAWMRGERSMPFGHNNEHVPVRLIDLDDLAQNQYIVTQQFIYRAGPTERRADLVLLVNGLPLVLIEAKTPVKKCISWVDGAVQVHDDYEKFVPELFVCNVFSVATEGKAYHYGSIGLPVKDWGPWHLDGNGEDGQHHPLKSLKLSAESMLRPHVVLDILGSFTLFATNKKKQRIKIICRYQQFEAANKIVERVLAGYPRKGLIWHFQGSGKSLLMVFAAQKLRMHAGLKNPTVLIVVDRIDLDSQITGTFTGADIPNLEKADTREKLQQLLAQDVRKIIITTIFKFGEATGSLNDRSNIIALVDEAHRTQEGDLGRKMREALPNAFLFGLTGTPINR